MPLFTAQYTEIITDRNFRTKQQQTQKEQENITVLYHTHNDP
jgi:hypothetical protein